MSASTNQIAEAIELFKNAREVFVVTGAGISAESGLPTYRGIGGLYDNETTEDEIAIEVALSGPMFRARPEITWKYLVQIEQGARGASFNRAHEILAELESRYRRMWVLTQNVDGFHSSAGSKNVIEIHGNLHRMKCTHCSHKKTHSDYTDFVIPPICPDCGKGVRPDVVLFEEQLPQQAVATLYEQLERPFELVVSVGTSAYFPYITEPVVRAAQVGIPTIEINPGETPISDIVDVKLSMGAKNALERIWNGLNDGT